MTAFVNKMSASVNASINKNVRLRKSSGILRDGWILRPSRLMFGQCLAKSFTEADICPTKSSINGGGHLKAPISINRFLEVDTVNDFQRPEFFWRPPGYLHRWLLGVPTSLIRDPIS
jgi:hypothetical protein